MTHLNAFLCPLLHFRSQTVERSINPVKTRKPQPMPGFFVRDALSALGFEPRTYGLKVRGPVDVTDLRDNDLGNAAATVDTEWDTPIGNSAVLVDAELAQIVASWPTLPDPIRRAIVAMVATLNR
jgi:hypothetical protein